MGFNILPKNVITGKNASGEKFEAFEYDFKSYALMQIGPLIGTILVGGIFSAISGFIVLIMVLALFNGRFNPISLAVPILSGFWLWDAHTGFLFSSILNFFIDREGVLFLCHVNIANIVVVSVVTIFGGLILRYINSLTDDIPSRYVLFYIGITVLYVIFFILASDKIDMNWIGLKH